VPNRARAFVADLERATRSICSSLSFRQGQGLRGSQPGEDGDVPDTMGPITGRVELSPIEAMFASNASIALGGSPTYLGLSQIDRSSAPRGVLFGYSSDAQCRRIFAPEFCVYKHDARPQPGQRQLRLDGQDFPRNLRGFAPSPLFDETHR
jgi:hypothetical protein